MNPRIEQAVAELCHGPLCESAIDRHIAPLFSRVLSSNRIYLANHSLGRPLDSMANDLAEATAFWYDRLGDAWDAWLEEREAFRSRIATLIGAPRVDCVIPKTSAGQGLRTVLNSLPGNPRVVTTRGEFDSIDVILKQYAALGRIELHWIDPDPSGNFCVEALIESVGRGADLVVVSQVMFMSGQIMDGLDRLADACHRLGARLLVDSYHAIGVIPVDAAPMQCDFMIGGSYKYLRGGPGACFLYISPSALDSDLRPLDTGWFANSDEFAYQRPDLPVFKPGGDAFLEATPPILTWYQARSGQQFTLAMGIERLRAYSLRQLGLLREHLANSGVNSVIGGDARHGAFLAIRLAGAIKLPPLLHQKGIICDARGEWLRLCPDCLTRDEEMRRAASVLSDLLHGKS
ncbi:MAG: aminotransferase class V-fold PLP-dependent enzyme [Silvibacterium sp.]|nr:aminotransferase class V-fold PLP-dependent enzyme [Silvibacterium sp.]